MADPKRKHRKSGRSPAEQGIAPGLGKGGVPVPSDHQFPPGQSGNPGGRPSAGATLKEQLNALAQAGLTEAQLRKIARDPKLSWTRRAAARRILRTLEEGDLADFDPLVRDGKSLKQLRRSGVNTAVLKKIKLAEEGGYEITLHDRSGDDFDRICDQTEPRPKVAVHHTSDGSMKPPDPIVLVHTAPPPPVGEEAGG